MSKSTLKMWLETARPKTLPLAAATIITGSSLAAWASSFSWKISLLCLITTLLLQILSNFANDYGDHQKGSDTAERIGPLRGIQQGVITAKQLKITLYFLVFASILTGGWLIASAYREITDLIAFALLGVIAIIAAITYTVGNKPYGYLGLGDISVLIFFGFLGIGGTFYLQTYQIEPLIFLPALGSGLLATAVLNINNLRDIEQDRKVGKNTLAVRLGAKGGRIYHCLLLGIAASSYALFTLCTFQHWSNLLFFATYPLLLRHARYVYQNPNPLSLRPMLAQMSALALLINLLFSFGLLVG